MPLDQEEVEIEKKEKSMSFLDHVDELRGHLFRSAVVVFVFFIVAFYYIKDLVHIVILGPVRKDFFTYDKLCQLSEYLYQDKRLCVGDFPIVLQNLEMQGQFLMAIKIAFVAGFVLAFPYIVWELWRFVKPALSKNELRSTKGILFACSMLFFMGVLFGYYVLSPISINFFVFFSISDLIENHYTISSIVGFITVLVMGTGLVFQLPVLMYFLARIGLLSSSFLKKYRRHAIVIIIIVGAIITPPDVFSQIILCIPIYTLYEVGILITQRVEKRKQHANI